MSNFTGQKIKDTYQALLQISGSDVLADGTGSVVTNLDISASYASNAGNAATADLATAATTAVSASHALVADNGGVTSLTAGDNISLSSGVGDITISAVTASAQDTGSLLSNASFSNPDITYTRGDGTTFTNTLTTLVPTSASHAVQADSAISSSHAVQADSATSADSATVAGEVNVASDATNATRYVSFTDTTSGQDYQRVDAGLTYNPFTNTLSTTTFAGNATSADSATTATSASHAVQADNATTADSATTAGSATTATSASHAVNADDAISSSYASNAEQLDGLDSTAFAILSASNTFTGATNTFNNDVVINGTASINYLQSVTGSAKIVGDAFIILNNDTPTERYAGIIVQDSGSNNTASFQYDGQTNDWFYEYEGDDPTNFGVTLFGPEYANKGVPAYPIANQIQKGTGGHHLTGSLLSDDGSTVSMTGELDVTGGVSSSAGFVGDLTGNADTATTASFAVTASTALDAGGLKVGTAPDTLRSILTTTPATATQTGSIAIGNAATSTGEGSVAMGNGADATTEAAIAIGLNTTAGTSNDTIAIGNNTSAAGDRSISIGKDTSNTGQRAAAFGEGQIVSGVDAVSIGTGNVVSNNYTVVLGKDITNTAEHGINIGRESAITGTHGIAMGYQASAAGNAIAIGSGSSAAANGINLINKFTYTDATSTFAMPGNVVISGSLNVSSSITANNVLTNQTDTYASVPNIHEVVTLSKTEYDAISGSADDNTLYVISGSEVLNISDTVRNNEDTFTPAKVEQLVTLTKTEYDGVSGSADPNTLYVITNDTGSGAYIEGPLTSNVNALTIASNTASMDCSTANFFTITLVSGSDTHLVPSNIQSGQTLNLRVSQANPGNGTLSFGPGIASGSVYTATAGAGPEDILTFIAFDDTTLYTSFVQDLV